MSTATPTFGWGHININVSDLDRAIAFYKLLGFSEFLPRIPYLSIDSSQPPKPMAEGMDTALGMPASTRARACIMQLGDSFPKIDLTEVVGMEPKAPLNNADRGLVRFCLTSEGLVADVARLKAAGVPFLSGPVAAPGGLADVAVCHDPDGTLIELLQVYLENWAPLLESWRRLES